MPQDIPATCYGCGKKLKMDHTLSRPWGGLVLERHDNDAKEWDHLGSWALILSTISYTPLINSNTVQGERTRAGARREGDKANNVMYIDREDQWGGIYGRNKESAADLVRGPGQVTVPAE